MTAIPEDVKEALDRVFFNLIMAERRRCAVIARQWQESPHKDETFAANSIADKIMAGGK